MNYKKITTYTALLSLSGTLLSGCAGTQVTQKPNDSRQIVRADVLSKQEQLVKKLSMMMDEKEAFDAGKYKKGELKKGDYVFINMNNNTTPAHFEEKNGGEMFFQSFGYVTISGEEEVSFERGFILPIENLEKLNVRGAKELYEKYNGISDYKGPGYYKIGTDIDRGLVTVQATGKNSYAALLTSPTRKDYNIAAMNHISDQMVIDTNRGAYLNLNNAEIKKVEKGKKKEQPVQKQSSKKQPSVKHNDFDFLYIDDDIYIENTYIMFLSYELIAQFNYWMNLNLYMLSLEFSESSNDDINVSFYSSRKQTLNNIKAEKAIENEKEASKEEKEEADKVQDAARKLLENMDLQFAGQEGEGKLNQEIIDLTSNGITFDRVDITNNGHLSNGDKETLALFYNGEVVAESEVTVSGLEDVLDKEDDEKELEKLSKEALKKAKLAFEGVNGQGFTQPTTITVDDVTFDVYSDNTEALSNGDTVTLYISYNDEVMGEKEVKVEGLKDKPEDNIKDDGYINDDFGKEAKEDYENLSGNFENDSAMDDLIGAPVEDMIDDTIESEEDETESLNDDLSDDEEDVDDSSSDEAEDEDDSSSEEEESTDETIEDNDDNSTDASSTEEENNVDEEDTAEEDAEYEASLSREEEEYEASMSREEEEEAREQEIADQGQVVADQLANSMTFSGEEGSGIAQTDSAPSPYTVSYGSTSGLSNGDSVDVTVCYNGEEVGWATADVDGLTEPEEEEEVIEEEAPNDDEGTEGDEYYDEY